MPKTPMKNMMEEKTMLPTLLPLVTVKFMAVQFAKGGSSMVEASNDVRFSGESVNRPIVCRVVLLSAYFTTAFI